MIRSLRRSNQKRGPCLGPLSLARTRLGWLWTPYCASHGPMVVPYNQQALSRDLGTVTASDPAHDHRCQVGSAARGCDSPFPRWARSDADRLVRQRTRRPAVVLQPEGAPPMSIRATEKFVSDKKVTDPDGTPRLYGLARAGLCRIADYGVKTAAIGRRSRSFGSEPRQRRRPRHLARRRHRHLDTACNASHGNANATESPPNGDPPPS